MQCSYYILLGMRVETWEKMEPTTGPSTGGTIVTIQGMNFDISSSAYYCSFTEVNTRVVIVSPSTAAPLSVTQVTCVTTEWPFPDATQVQVRLWKQSKLFDSDMSAIEIHHESQTSLSNGNGNSALWQPTIATAVQSNRLLFAYKNEWLPKRLVPEQGFLTLVMHLQDSIINTSQHDVSAVYQCLYTNSLGTIVTNKAGKMRFATLE